MSFTDDDLGSLLTETFRAREHLAEPGRAVAIASSPGRPRHRGRILLGSAAAVALVAGGTSYVAIRDARNPAPVGVPRHVPQPPIPPHMTSAESRRIALKASDRVLSRLPVYPGADETDLAVPPLRNVSGPAPAPHSVGGNRFWLVPGASAQAVATWYAAHPPSGFHTEGGRTAVGSQGTAGGGDLVYDVTWHEPFGDRLPPPGTSIEVYTRDTAAGVAVRIDVGTLWLPARRRASFVQDASSIEVTTRHTHDGHPVQVTTRSFTVTDPARVLDAAKAFDALDAAPPTGPVSCPVMLDVYRDRIVFHTATGDVVVTTGADCLDLAYVRRDGKLILPALADGSSFLSSLGLDH